MSIDWLPFSLPKKFRVGDPSSLLSKAAEIEVSRSPDYRLSITAIGGGAPKRDKLDTEAIRERIDLDLLGEPFLQGKLIGYFPSNLSTNFKFKDAPVTKENGIADRLHIFYRKSETATAITEWVVNFPDDRHWPRTTDRESIVTEWIERDSAKIRENVLKTSSASHDHARINLDLPTVSFIRFGQITTDQVNEPFKVKRPGFIEYSAGGKGLPDEKLRYSIRMALAFIFGCGFGVLGRTETSADGYPIVATAISAFIPGGENFPTPPVLLHERSLDDVDEALVTEFLKRYIQCEAVKQLDLAVWLYLYSFSAPLNMAAGYLGGAFEILRRYFYSLASNEHKTRLLPKTIWKTISSEIFNTIDKIIVTEKQVEFASQLEEIKSRVGGLNSVSGTKLNTLLLEDLGIQYGIIEQDALKARNDSVHANSLGSEGYLETLRRKKALHTLVARVFFRVLQFDDIYYLDYSALDPSTLRPTPKLLNKKQG
ncbi:MAG: hypothetical protein C4542_08875 [Dehalococcoidia bacterium]|nr:MAG: hypothetical protein C4542_08875 [Dehalococcoidia bacterium]